MKHPLAIFAIFASLAAAQPIRRPTKTSPETDGAILSSGWSGYIATIARGGQSETTSEISGQWIVPSVTCPSTGSASYSVAWIGIGGYESQTVEQIGTGSDCLPSGASVYYAWYEIYPQEPRMIVFSGSVGPGDLVSASVSIDKRQPDNIQAPQKRFVVAIEDLTSGMRFSASIIADNPGTSSAEWIIEAPVASDGSILPLANFGSALFTHASASIGRTNAELGSFPANSTLAVTMQQSVAPIAFPSTLGASGSFSVSWLGY